MRPRRCAPDDALPAVSWDMSLAPPIGEQPPRYLPHWSAERERKRLHTRIEELDLELAINDGFRLADGGIQPLIGGRAAALGVNVISVRGARRLSIKAHAEAHGC